MQGKNMLKIMNNRWVFFIGTQISLFLTFFVFLSQVTHHPFDYSIRIAMISTLLIPLMGYIQICMPNAWFAIFINMIVIVLIRFEDMNFIRFTIESLLCVSTISWIRHLYHGKLTTCVFYSWLPGYRGYKNNTHVPGNYRNNVIKIVSHNYLVYWLIPSLILSFVISSPLIVMWNDYKDVNMPASLVFNTLVTFSFSILYPLSRIIIYMTPYYRNILAISYILLVFLFAILFVNGICVYMLPILIFSLVVIHISIICGE